MVESTTGSAGLLEQCLDQEWLKLASQQAATNTFISQSVKRPLEEAGIVAFYN